MIKSINLSWVSQTSLTNLNSGEGGSNYIDVKKYKWQGEEYPYVSGQAMRFYLKEAIRRQEDYKLSCIPNDKGESCGDVENCQLCDLFGFMTTKKKEGRSKGNAMIRVSPVKVSPAIGLLPFDENSNVDFLTRKKRDTLNTTELGGDIVNVEMGMNIYKCGIAIDVVRIGREEVIAEGERRTLKLTDLINEEERKNRIINVMNAVLNIADYSKQARLLTDFTPDFLICSAQNVYNHKLQKAIEMNDIALNIQRFKEVIKEIIDEGGTVYVGMRAGLFENEEEIIDACRGLGIEVKQPNEVIKEISKKVTEDVIS